MKHLTERDRISLLILRGWNDRLRSYQDVKDLFNVTFRNENTPISKSTVERTVRRFEETGSVKNRPKTGRPATTNEEKALDVLQSFVENPQTSVRRTAQEHEINPMSVHKILKQNKFRPYKILLVHELNEDNFDQRVQFCETMMAKIDAEPDFLSNIVLSDKATFQLNGIVNRHNCKLFYQIRTLTGCGNTIRNIHRN